MSIDEDMKSVVSHRYSFEQTCRLQAIEVAKHIKAMLKPGVENRLDRDDIALQLELHGLDIPEHIVSDALMLLYATDVKRGKDYTYYLRKFGELKDEEWC